MEFGKVPPPNLIEVRRSVPLGSGGKLRQNATPSGHGALTVVRVGAIRGGRHPRGSRAVRVHPAVDALPVFVDSHDLADARALLRLPAKSTSVRASGWRGSTSCFRVSVHCSPPFLGACVSANAEQPGDDTLAKVTPRRMRINSQNACESTQRGPRRASAPRRFASRALSTAPPAWPGRLGSPLLP